MTRRWLGLAAALIALLASAFFWSRLPDQVATHWNMRGEANDWSSRAWASLFGPAIIVGLMGRIRPNWFMGIRTPWTIESEEVWRKTHRLAGWLFVAAGIAVGLAVLIPAADALIVALVSMLVAAFVPAALSLVFWLKEKRS